MTLTPGTLHDVGEHEGATFLVKEYLAGETIAQRLARGPLPLAQALGVASEIAEALTAAHRHGVIHRPAQAATPAGLGVPSLRTASGTDRLQVLEDLAHVFQLLQGIMVVVSVTGVRVDLLPDLRQESGS